MTYYVFNARRTSRGMTDRSSVNTHIDACAPICNACAVNWPRVDRPRRLRGCRFWFPLSGTPLLWIVMLAPLGFVPALSFGIQRMSADTAMVLFWIYPAVRFF
jgi:hypothetical protein